MQFKIYVNILICGGLEIGIVSSIKRSIPDLRSNNRHQPLENSNSKFVYASKNFLCCLTSV